MKVESTDSLIDISFKICSALMEVGINAVLVGGSAASFYAPSDYMSTDADFCISFHGSDEKLTPVMKALGFRQISGRMWASQATPITVDFVGHTILIGDEEITEWRTEVRDGLTLNVLNPSDIIMDRLLCFGSWNDRQAFLTALAIAKAAPDDLDLKLLEARCKREGITDALSQFLRRLEQN